MRTAVEALFDAMVSDGWAMHSSGDVASPTGHFAIVRNEANELSEIRDAFDDVIAMYGFVNDSDLIGNFIVITDNYGNVNVTRCGGWAVAMTDYSYLLREFERWDSQ